MEHLRRLPYGYVTASVSVRACMQVARVPVRTFAEGDIPATLNLSFSTPEQQLYKNFQAKMVTMKGSSGVFGVLPGHVPTIAQLQPGVVTVEYDGDSGTQVRFVCVRARDPSPRRVLLETVASRSATRRLCRSRKSSVATADFWDLALFCAVGRLLRVRWVRLHQGELRLRCVRGGGVQGVGH